MIQELVQVAKMLTDLYGAHQRRGLKPRSVYDAPWVR